MSFLAPWFLALGAAVVVPLLIHLLRRRIGLQVDFPAARYLARAERDHSRTMRMRNLLLMLLRVVTVLLLAMAAARPTARLAGAGHAPTALAIVLDNSMSTSVVEDGAPLLARLKDMASDVLASATPEDRVWIVTADGVVRGGGVSAMREELQRIRPLAGSGAVHDAVARALATVEASGLEARHVAVLTDGQRTEWKSPVQTRGESPVLVWAPDESPPLNRAVIAAESRPARWTPRGAVAARALSQDSITYRMGLGDRTLARGTIAPGEEAIVRAAPSERGWTGGVIEIEPDELVADNIRHFALWIGPAPSVTVTPGAGIFARNAIDVLRSTERVADGVGIQVASADEAGTLPALLFPPQDAVRLGAANRVLERLGVPWRYGPARREAALAHGEHLRDVAVSLRYQLVPHGVPDSDTLAMVGREPWIVAGTGYVLVGSPLAPAATSLPITAGFLPWFGDAIASRLNAEPGAVRYALPGQRVPRPAGVEAIESGTGNRTMLSGSAFDAPTVAGVYFMVRGARRVGALVVNPESDESRLERWPAAELGARIVTAGARVVRRRDEWVRDAFAGVARRSMVFPLLLALLLVLAAETLAAAGSARVQP
ncbi:MAG: BatA and WFA domain-containing protein [Gemmatimonadota bacterium]